MMHTNLFDKLSSSEMNFRPITMKRSALNCSLCLLLVLALTGCGIAQRIQNGRTTPMSLRNNQPGYFTSTKHSIDFGNYFFPIFVIPALIDIPFSLAADIIALPVEIVMDSHENYRKDQDKQFWETYFASGASLSTPEEGLKRLSQGGRATVINHILKTNPLPKHQLIDLIHIGFVNEIAEYQILDRELFELCLGKQEALPHIIRNPSVIPQMLHEIILSSQIKLTEESMTDLARSSKTSQADLESLYPSPSHFVINTLSENPNTPDSVLCRIFADSKNNYRKQYVSRNMASRASVPPEIQNFIFMSDDEYAKARLIQNKSVIPEIRSALIEPKLISVFCERKLLSPAQVKQLFDEASPDIQAVMKENKTIMSYIDKAEKE